MEAERRGLPVPDIRVATRTGDTSQSDRRDLVRHPPDILVTTPESLYLMLTSQAREVLRSVEHVIVDEIHSVAPTKRGAHLALSLERLERLTAAAKGPPQRIGLSATQRPLDEVARFLGGRARDATHRRVAPPAGRRRRRRGAQAARAAGRRAGGGHGRAGPGRPRHARRPRRRRPRGPPLDLAGDPSRPARPDPRPHVHPDLRQLPPPGRAPGRPTQRAGHQPERDGRAGGAGAGPPRVDREGAAARDRGRPQGRQAPRARSPPAASSWASTWAPSTSSSRWRRRRRWRAASSASAGPATRWGRRRRAASSPSSGATWSSPRSSSAG